MYILPLNVRCSLAELVHTRFSFDVLFGSLILCFCVRYNVGWFVGTEFLLTRSVAVWYRWGDKLQKSLCENVEDFVECVWICSQ